MFDREMPTRLTNSVARGREGGSLLLTFSFWGASSIAAFGGGGAGGEISSIWSSGTGGCEGASTTISAGGGTLTRSVFETELTDFAGAKSGVFSCTGSSVLAGAGFRSIVGGGGTKDASFVSGGYAGFTSSAVVGLGVGVN